MDYREFDKLVDARIEKIRNTLLVKAKEYAGPVDRLYNFKRAAEIERTTPERALAGMWVKHVVSVLDMIEHAEIVHSESYVDEKIGDSVNYLILLEALLAERRAADMARKVKPVEPVA